MSQREHRIHTKWGGLFERIMELREEIARFDSWFQAQGRSCHEWVWNNSHWEVDDWQREYPYLEALFDAVRAVLDGPIHQIDPDDIAYLLGRDTNDNRLRGMLVKRAEVLYSIAEYAANFPDESLRLRLAVALEQIGGLRAERLLKAFFPNTEEYVLRRKQLARIVASTK